MSRKGSIAWNKGIEYLSPETRARCGFKKGHKSWNEGLTKETDIRLKKVSENISATRKKLFASGKLKVWLEGRHDEYIGNKNPNWRGGVTFLKCMVCKKPFQEHRNTKFCSWKCRREHYREKNTHKCLICGISFYKRNCKGRTFKFCSMLCRNEGLHRLYQNPEYRQKHIEATLKGLFQRPTSLEKDMIRLIEKNNLPYKYTGNGSFLIGFKNPDFVNVNGEKICIEVRARKMCETWNKCSPEEYSENQIKHYNKYGWNCIVLFGIINKRNNLVILEKPEDEILSLINRTGRGR